MQFVRKKGETENRAEKKWQQQNAAPCFILENICQRLTVTKRKTISRKNYSDKTPSNKSEEGKKCIIICMNCVSTREKKFNGIKVESGKREEKNGQDRNAREGTTMKRNR